MAVVEQDSATKPRFSDRREALDDAAGTKNPGLSKSKFPGQEIVRFEPDPVVAELPSAVGGDHHREPLGKVRGIAEQQAPLVKCVSDQGNVTLGQVANSSMNQLRASAGCSLAEIVLFKKDRAIASRGCLDGDSKSGSTTPNDHDVDLRGSG